MAAVHDCVAITVEIVRQHLAAADHVATEQHLVAEFKLLDRLVRAVVHRDARAGGVAEHVLDRVGGIRGGVLERVRRIGYAGRHCVQRVAADVVDGRAVNRGDGTRRRGVATGDRIAADTDNGAMAADHVDGRAVDRDGRTRCGGMAAGDRIAADTDNGAVAADRVDGRTVNSGDGTWRGVLAAGDGIDRRAMRGDNRVGVGRDVNGGDGLRGVLEAFSDLRDGRRCDTADDALERAVVEAAFGRKALLSVTTWFLRWAHGSVPLRFGRPTATRLV